MNNATIKFLSNAGHGYTIPAHLAGVLPEVTGDPRSTVVASNGEAFLMADGRWCDKFEMLHRRECIGQFGQIVSPKALRKHRQVRGY